MPIRDPLDHQAPPPGRVMFIDLAGAIEITIVRPILQRLGVDTPVESHPPIKFTRAEWALMVNSGLWNAICRYGWRTWDDVTVHRAATVPEKDHLLLIANLFIEGYSLDFYRMATHPQCPDILAYRALALLSAAAALHREENLPQPTPEPIQAVYYRRLGPPPAMPIENRVEGTHIETLVDLAKQGEEATFKDLAQAVGVQKEHLDELWQGTVARVRRGERIVAPDRNPRGDA